MLIGALAALAGSYLMLMGGAVLLVRGLTRAAHGAGLAPYAVGMTALALGTSTPELALNVHYGLRGESQVVLETVVGSNTFNLLVVLGVAAVIGSVRVSQAAAVLKRDIPVLCIAIISVLPLALDGDLTRLDSLTVIVMGLFYMWYVAREGRVPHVNFSLNSHRSWWVEVLIGVAGLLLLTLGAVMLPSAASEVGTLLEGSVGTLFGDRMFSTLAVLATSTSLPEAVVIVVAVASRQTELAVGGVIGSTIFNSTDLIKRMASQWPARYAGTSPSDLRLPTTRRPSCMSQGSTLTQRTSSWRS